MPLPLRALRTKEGVGVHVDGAVTVIVTLVVVVVVDGLQLSFGDGGEGELVRGGLACVLFTLALVFVFLIDESAQVVSLCGGLGAAAEKPK